MADGADVSTWESKAMSDEQEIPFLRKTLQITFVNERREPQYAIVTPVYVWLIGVLLLIAGVTAFAWHDLQCPRRPVPVQPCRGCVVA